MSSGGAEGGEDFGNEKSPLLEKTDDQDDDKEEEVNTTKPYQPVATSNPYHGGEQVEMKTKMHEKSGLPSWDETSFSGRSATVEEIEKRLFALKDPITKILNIDKADKQKILLTEEEKRSQLLQARKYLKANYANGKPENLVLGFFGEKQNQIVLKGPKGGLTKVFLDDGSGLTKKFKDLAFVKKILGEPTPQIVQQQSDDIRKRQKEPEKYLPSISEDIKKRDATEKSYYQTKSLEDMKNEDTEMQRQEAKFNEVLQDENSSPSDKQDARDSLDGIKEDRARLQSYMAERERELPLSERVKEIFKKYGVTVTSVLLAAGITIGVVVSTVTNALKASTKALGKGLKNIGAKLGSLLPGLIGSVASFLFKAAGQAIGFLAEHTWLLVLAVVAFLFEKNIKKRR